MTEARRAYNRAYYQRNKERLAGYKAWQQKHDVNYRLRSILNTIVQRCTDPRHVSYRWYGGKGIQNFLTFDDLVTLWRRDRASGMKKPSIDRRDANGHYEISNCFFSKLRDNQKRAWANKSARAAAIRQGMLAAKHSTPQHNITGETA